MLTVTKMACSMLNSFGLVFWMEAFVLNNDETETDPECENVRGWLFSVFDFLSIVCVFVNLHL